MALIKCPECGNDVSTEATACPKCGCPIKKQKIEPKPQQETQPVNQQNSSTGSGCGTVILVIIAIIAAILMLVTCSGGSSSKSSNDWNTESWAKSYAQIIVKDNLKAPSTAKFCNTAREMTAKNMGGSKWKVTGWVDAENSFGAMIRSDFEVVLELNSNGATKISCTIKKR